MAAGGDAYATVETVASDRLAVRLTDLFNPPGLTNFLGAAQAAFDVTAVRAVSFPPVTLGDAPTGSLFVDGRLAASLGGKISFRWRPDRIERRLRHQDLDLRSLTVVPLGHTAVAVRLRVHNRGAARTVRVGFSTAPHVASVPGPWHAIVPEVPDGGRRRRDGSRCAVSRTSDDGRGCVVQGLAGAGVHDARVSIVDGGTGLSARVQLGAGASWTVVLLTVVGPGEDAAWATFDELAGRADRLHRDAEKAWNAELAGMFSDGGPYPGRLPVLHTRDAAVTRLYQLGALGVAYFRRDSPHSVLGRTYDTLMPRYWQTLTFLWDFSLSSLVHGLFEPGVLRQHLEHWMHTDIHTHLGTEWLTGAPFANWYAVNDYAMARMAFEYLRLTGDVGWLTTPLAKTGRTPLEYLAEYAASWHTFAGDGELAEYGGLGNLLECVSSYTHQVASLNAAAAWTMRLVADLHELTGEPDAAGPLRDTAARIARAVNGLYLPDRGHFAARHPGEVLVPVAHCYDIATVTQTLGGDLTALQRAQMTQFVTGELADGTWMRALATVDTDAAFSVRPDHQWTGAYTAWPADAVRALCELGGGVQAGEWLRRLARSANQGPFGQAHFAPSAVKGHRGGARKAPSDPPWYTDWACSAGGAWVSAVVEGLFGVKVALDGTVTATPRLAGFDPDARLTGLVVRGRVYDVDADGVHEVPADEAGR